MLRNYFSNKYGLHTILSVLFMIESTTAIGGLLGLKALTGDRPYLGFGNPWITWPAVADGGAGLYGPYGLHSPWDYGGAFIYNPYQTQSLPYGSFGGPYLRNPTIFQSGVPNSIGSVSSTGIGGKYYKGKGNPWITQ